MKRLIILWLLNSTILFASTEWNRIIDLRGTWKFNLGDDMEWINPDYNHSDWEDIFVPSPWEDEGFPGYDGYAWYRIEFEIDAEHKNKNLYIRLWQIDDVDEVYINGNFVGFSGSFPPEYMSAYNIDRQYRIPLEYLNFDGPNIVAVRIYDKELGGGILRGRVGIYERKHDIESDIPLEGKWKFMVGDNPEWKEHGYNDHHWQSIMVPANWEVQGYRDYDGFAWYRARVIIPYKYKDQDLILFLGKIDDYDQVFMNGHLVGRTGDFPPPERDFTGEDKWLQWRAYTVDRDFIFINSENVIAVRVYDGYMHGGIYEGPVGIMTRDTYRKVRSKLQSENKGFFESIFWK